MDAKQVMDKARKLMDRAMTATNALSSIAEVNLALKSCIGGQREGERVLNQSTFKFQLHTLLYKQMDEPIRIPRPTVTIPEHVTVPAAIIDEHEKLHEIKPREHHSTISKAVSTLFSRKRKRDDAPAPTPDLNIDTQETELIVDSDDEDIVVPKRAKPVVMRRSFLATIFVNPGDKDDAALLRKILEGDLGPLAQLVAKLEVCPDTKRPHLHVWGRVHGAYHACNHQMIQNILSKGLKKKKLCDVRLLAPEDNPRVINYVRKAATTMNQTDIDAAWPGLGWPASVVIRGEEFDGVEAVWVGPALHNLTIILAEHHLKNCKTSCTCDDVCVIDM